MNLNPKRESVSKKRVISIVEKPTLCICQQFLHHAIWKITFNCREGTGTSQLYVIAHGKCLLFKWNTHSFQWQIWPWILNLTEIATSSSLKWLLVQHKSILQLAVYRVHGETAHLTRRLKFFSCTRRVSHLRGFLWELSSTDSTPTSFSNEQSMGELALACHWAL